MADCTTTPARPFGLVAADLEIEFSSADRPALVTAVLAACAAPHDSGHWWARSVGARHLALLSVLQASGGQAPPLLAACPACEERAEFELPLEALCAGPAADEAAVEVDLGGRHLRLRRPTGADLRAWRERPAPGPTRSDVLRELVSAGELQPADDEAAARALADADPLVAFSVRGTCPTCGRQAEYEVDLEALALSRLAALQRATLQEVHCLASHYGWTEEQVLAVPPLRRARYLALIEAES